MASMAVDPASRLPQDLNHPIFKETDPRKVREIIRRGEWTRNTKGLALGHAQLSLAILPRSDAYDFLVFCQRNPIPCSALEVTEVGDPEPKYLAPGADLRTDVPRYCVYQRGELTDEPTDITPYWRDDFVGFLLSCSITFDAALLANDIPIKQWKTKRGPTLFKSNIQCRPAGKFRGPVVISLRPMRVDKAIRAIQVTSRFPWNHGAPVHIGDPSLVGIEDLNKPDWGTPIEIDPGEIPVFWACGVTPQAVALEAKVDIMITHAPGCMFITDMKDEHFTVF